MINVTKNTLFPLIKEYLSDNPLIIEAGAFNGRDTQRLAAFWPHGTVHAFEPVPEIFALLTQHTAQLPNVHRHNIALTNTTGTATFYVSESPKNPEQPFAAGSLLKPKERLKLSAVEYKKTITVPTITLDEWAQQQNITAIDFLWLDMQGNELNALQGATEILPTVRVIYTEVEFVEAYEGQPLYKDVRAWLEAQGFVMIAKDFPDKPTWFFGNALFVRG